MTRKVSIVALLALGGGLSTGAAGCAGVDDNGNEISNSDNSATDGNSATDEAALSWRLRQHRLRLRAPATTTATGTSTGSSNTGSTGSSSSSALDPAAVAAAARTPDGAAIPQPAGPNGQCPDVLVVFGFWSCPTINEQCSFQSGGSTTSCTCSRTDGEGQLPSWVCGS